jgi:hypothetical protein
LSEIFKKLFDLKISLIDKKIEDEDCFFYKYSLMKDIEEYVNQKLIKEDLQPEDGRKSGRRKLGFAASEKEALRTNNNFDKNVRECVVIYSASLFYFFYFFLVVLHLYFLFHIIYKNRLPVTNLLPGFEPGLLHI